MCESELTRALAAQPVPFEHAVFSKAVWHQGAREGTCGQIRFLTQRPEESDALLRYPQVTLERRMLSGPDLGALVMRALREQSEKEPTTQWQRHDGYHRDGPRTWPLQELIIGGLHDSVDQSSAEPIIAYGLPPYANLHTAIVSWFRGRDTSPGCWRILLPDHRAHISAGEFHGDGRVEIRVESATSDLEIQVVFASANSEAVGSDRARMGSSSVSLVAPAGADRATVYVVAADHAILDRLVMRRAPREPAAVEHETLVERCARDLHDGEHEQVEIKPWIGPGSGKENEVLHTIIAFANTSGGRLYIGVDNDGVPENAKELFDRFPKKSRREGESVEDAVLGWLRKLVQEGLLRRPSFREQFIEHPRGRVLCVEVEAGPDGPYATKENDIFVRRGSNNRRPDADRVSLDAPGVALSKFSF